MRIKILALILVIGYSIPAFCQSRLQEKLEDSSKTLSQKPNYPGTWVVNLQKSKLQADWTKGLTEGVFTISQSGDKFELSRYFIINNKKRKLRYKMIADGKTRRKKLFFRGKLEWKRNTLRATIFRNGFLDIVNYKVGDNQNELIADEVFKGVPQDYYNHWVFERENSK
ncbi:MAG TPA: hypothetical protein VF691_11310 [Cytophagaceae bacterium]